MLRPGPLGFIRVVPQLPPKLGQTPALRTRPKSKQLSDGPQTSPKLSACHTVQCPATRGDAFASASDHSRCTNSLMRQGRNQLLYSGRNSNSRQPRCPSRNRFFCLSPVCFFLRSYLYMLGLKVCTAVTTELIRDQSLRKKKDVICF